MPLGNELCVVGVTSVRSAARDARAASQGQSGGLVGWPARRCERCGQFAQLDHQPVPSSDHTLVAEIHLAKPSPPHPTLLPFPQVSGSRRRVAVVRACAVRRNIAMLLGLRRSFKRWQE